jgi:hypothetical protein
MGLHRVHEKHDHQHEEGCGHPVVDHEGHRDYLHDGHLHHGKGDHFEEHVIAVSEKNPDACTQGHNCGAHSGAHRHGPSCGHDAIPHGGHVDYVVDGHLHHPHETHCDDHGTIAVRGTLART